MNVVEPVEPVDEVGCCPRQPCCEVKSRSDFGCSGERMSKTQLLQQLDREKHEHLKIQQLEQDNLRLKQEMKGILQEMERMKVRLCKLEQSNEKPSSPVLSHTLQPQDKRQKSKYKDMEDVQGMGSQDKIGLKGFNPFDDKKLGLRSCRRLFERLMADKRGRDHVGSIRVPDMDSMLDFRVEDEAEVYYEVSSAKHDKTKPSGDDKKLSSDSDHTSSASANNGDKSPKLDSAASLAEPNHLFPIDKKVDYFYSAVTLTNRQQEVDILHLLIRTLALIKTLNISGCSITDQGTDLVTAIIHKASSLEELDISHANLNSLKCITISRALKNISSLRFFRINNNFITEEATDSIIEAVCSNFLLEELKLSNNQLTSVAVTQIITTVSISNAIKVLDISKNCVSLNNVDNLSSAVRNCHTLQELKLSQNSLLFTGIICISEALRGHPNLKYLNVEKNVMSYFSETEFLVDVILSANEPLLYLNVCGRNIRPRFVEDHLVPPCGHEKQNNFVIQNLYLSCLVLNHVLKLIQNVEELSDMHNDNVIKVSEKCPITNEGISVYCVDNDGGTFYNKAHNFAIIIPPGAVLQGDRVQMQATASRFGPFQLPEGYYPISSFFWISADYTFKLPVYLILSHHASPRNLNELQKLRAMKASAQNTCPNGKQKLLMNEVVSGAFFDYKIGYCVISTCHFCSHCSTTDDITIPNIFHALYYMYNFKRCLMAEVCICHANRECIEVVETQYNNKKAELIRGLAFSFNSEQHLTINVDPIKLSAWDMTIETKKISYSQFNFRTHTKDTLEKMESVGSYPPRFVVTYCTKNVPYEPLSSKITVSTGEEWGATFQVNDISDILQVPTISTKPPPIPFSETALQKEKESLLKKTPKMGDLVTIVIPKIKAEWEEVAYALYFDSPEVSAIGLKCLWDPKKCCREVFIDWIERGRGISPKTWSELLNRLKKIELVKAAEDIFKELHVIT